jgi:endonuclease/exonuclease/phosphatase family metal-dependent hydrolase
LLTLDHCYYESPLQLEETLLWQSRSAMIASDHLPLIAEFRVSGSSHSDPQQS